MSQQRIPGAPRTLEGDELNEAKKLLTTTFAGLPAGDGPTYQVGNVVSVTRQVVAGTKYKYVVDVSDGSVTEECTVTIWQQPWLQKNGNNVKIECKDVVKLNHTW
ncbi:cystatin-like protein isoform X2 [Drosophila kikkawai]|uniref:Cystatin-like protein isoform X2 n=1 Tax=Drosophila kikkawai TaxID=30033 RepID=A0A6P4IE39_DROKI|nr:cystatin-like protein isoform X2 [Drosophila kikkawai]